VNKKTMTRGALVGAVAIALIATTAGIASAAPQANGSEGPVGLFNPSDETYYPAGKTFLFNEETVGGQSTTDARATFECPADTTTVQTFVTAVGTERTRSAWSAWADAGLMKSNLEPTLQLNSMILGSIGQVRTNGGTYSLGLACLKDNNVNLASSGIWYTTIQVTAGTGSYTVTQPDTEAAPPVGSGSIDLEATTIAAVDGALSLVVPANSTAVIGNPTLVNKLSTSTGKLGTFSVSDERVLSHAGWTLTSTVTDFVNGDVTIDKKQLGIAPQIVSTTAAGVTKGAAQVAGSGVYPSDFATASNAAAVGTTVFDADLTFVAPADKAAGVYKSKLTLTLVSK
jgi:hypothetical protein